MEMRVMGSPAYYPLIEAGNNWYDCKASCELILDNTEELVFVVSTFDRPEKRRVGMMLPGMPTGWIQEHLGYTNFFIWVCICTLPGIVASLMIRNRLEDSFGKKQ